MCKEEQWEHRSLQWIHEARRQHQEEAESALELSPEAQAVAKRLGLPYAQDWPPVEKPEQNQ